jgi:ribosomal protein S18 acetylase RimI-like enzyme
MKEIRYIYRQGKYSDVTISPVTYVPDFFQLEIELESEVFYELRKKNGITPFMLRDSTPSEFEEIKQFFSNNSSSFFFLFDGEDRTEENLIGSILLLGNYIQCLAVASKYQRKGYGEQLVKYGVNHALAQGHKTVELTLIEGNTRALALYTKLGFTVKD